MKLRILFIIAFFPSIVFSQYYSPQISNDPIVKNDFYSYNHRLVIKDKDYQIVGIDTCRYCQIRNSKIKSLTIYSFASPTDSVKSKTFLYDSLGLTNTIGENFYTSSLIDIDCKLYIGPKRKPNTKYKQRDYKSVHKWETDSLGYVISYKEIAKGLGNRFLKRMLNGIVDYSYSFVYDSLYLSLKEYPCYSNRRRFRNCVDLIYDISEVRIDENGNLISEILYKHNSKGNLEFIRGHKYFYEYY